MPVIVKDPWSMCVYTVTTGMARTEEENNQILIGHYSWHVIDQSTGVDSEVQGVTESTLSGVDHFQKNDEMCRFFLFFPKNLKFFKRSRFLRKISIFSKNLDFSEKCSYF